ncbi:hypothetical protein L596_014204 [Steinernema carpocapsae]|uniref:Rad4 beta-hairpin domain-containing protein n=1 Tax=Steinernema carpocapsae TaxID=34508 RepID=A0A4U5NC69_STECR|nr:hypothetical protein L596_014204 [Steinernema carpocapsae]
MRRSARIAAKDSPPDPKPQAESRLKAKPKTTPKRKSVDAAKPATPNKKQHVTLKEEVAPKEKSEEDEVESMDTEEDDSKESETDSVSTSQSEYEDEDEESTTELEENGDESDDEFVKKPEKSGRKSLSSTKNSKAAKKGAKGHFAGLRKFTTPTGPTLHHSVPAKKPAALTKVEPVKSTHPLSEESDEEWDDVTQPSTSAAAMSKDKPTTSAEDLKVTIVSSDQEKLNEKMAREMQLAINREKKLLALQTHDVTLLCNCIHLHFTAKSILSEDACFIAQCRSLIPKGHVDTLSKKMDMLVFKKFLKWFGSAFVVASNEVSIEASKKKRFVERLEVLVGHKCYDTSRDLSSILFGCLVSMEFPARLGKAVAFSSEVNDAKEAKEQPKKKKKLKEYRDYFVEFWHPDEERWIALDPSTLDLDIPFKTAENFSPGFLYALAIDNKMGIRDVSARYADDFLTLGYRRKRTGATYLKETLLMKKFLAHRKRAKAEDMEFHDTLSLRPMPTTLSDFKNHPLYALEKDLLKFEAIYPSDQKPVGKVRGQDVYPRSCVRHLEGELFWLRQGRVVREGEEPYKIVKARPKMNVPKEEREDKPLPLYGHWQTDDFVAPTVQPDEPVPRNEYGNIYVYKSSMVPVGCKHMVEPGITSIAKKLQIDHVQAVVGWDFHGCQNHVILDGIVVHDTDEEILRNAWIQNRREQLKKVEEKAKKRVLGNWRKLINGAIGLDAIRKKFGVTSASKKNNHDPTVSTLDDDNDESQEPQQWPAGNFTLNSVHESREKKL